MAKRQKDNPIKVCRVCGDVLTVGENWLTFLEKSYDYRCKVCRNVRRRELSTGSAEFKVRKVDKARPTCLRCDVLLELGKNWSKRNSGRHSYICKACGTVDERRRRRAAGMKEIRVVNTPDNPIKYCRLCRTELVVGENVIPGDIRRSNYICRGCTIRETRRVKKEAIEKYGSVCACCGENCMEFLTIDHISGGGIQERGNGSGARFYRKLIREARRDDLRVLCMNCNHAIGLYGYCPHEGTYTEF
jgi:hypothetical protein